MTEPAQGTASGLPVTAKQQQVYNAIALFMSAHGRSPTRRELCKAAEVSSPGRLQVLLEALQARGLVDWLPNANCGLSVVQRGSGYAIPLELQQRLEAFCVASGDRPLAVVADAIAAFLDDVEPLTDDIRGGGN